MFKIKTICFVEMVLLCSNLSVNAFQSDSYRGHHGICMSLDMKTYDDEKSRTFFKKFFKTEHETKLVVSETEKGEVLDLVSINIFHLESDVKGLEKMPLWMHLHLEFKVPIVAAYIQAIAAPLGVPVGEFRSDINYLANYQGSDTYSTVYCTKRAASSLRHPQALLWNAESKNTSKDIHVAFNFLDVSCHEVSALQFLILYVKERNESYHAALSPVYYMAQLNEKFEAGGTGSPYPYSSDLKINCSSSKFDFASIVPSKYIVPNKDYDDCVLNSKGSDPTRICPPGPFDCSDTYNEYTGQQRDRQLHLNNICPCLHCGSPLHLLINDSIEIMKDCQFRLPYLDDKTKIFKPWGIVNKMIESEPPASLKSKEYMIEINQNFALNEQLSILFHGSLMFFVFFACLPVLIFGGRFMKEVPASHRLMFYGLGPWNLLHIIVAVFMLIALWVAMVESVGLDRITSGCTLFSSTPRIAEGCVDVEYQVHRHIYIGYFVFSLSILSFITGWIQPKDQTMRSLIVWVHSISGYIMFFFAVMEIYDTDIVCDDVKLIVLITIVLILVYFLGASMLQLFQNKNILLFPPRSVLPFLELIEFQTDCPFFKLKILNYIIFSFLVIVMVTVMSLALFSIYDGQVTLFKEDNKKLLHYNFSGFFKYVCPKRTLNGMVFYLSDVYHV